MEKVICIVGPTGVGKTALSIALAKHLNTEIISGDSIQVYRGLDIGSAKATAAEQQGVRHHLIDIIGPEASYSVKDFQDMARSISAKLHTQGKIPIIAGGTGLYIKSYLFDYHFDVSSDVDRNELNAYEEKTTEELYARLMQIDPEATKTIHPNNRKRIIRALAIFDSSGISKSEWIAKQKREVIYDAYLVGLTCPREILHERIAMRVNRMFEEGLLDEVKQLLKQGITFDHQCMQGIGYQEFRPYFANEATIEEVKEQIIIHTRQFAKRQYTWFRNQMNVIWYDITEGDVVLRVIDDVNRWMEEKA